MTDPSRPMRLAELVASLSLATDLGLGQPQEHVLRQTVLATRLAAAAGLSDADRAAVYYISLRAWVGCVADSPEMAHWYGDDLRIRADSYDVDKTGLPMMSFLLGHLATGGSPLRRLTMTGRFLAGGVRDTMDSFLTHCRTAADIAERLDLPVAVRAALPQAFERWDGHGVPTGLRGDAILPVMRVVHIADDAEVHAGWAEWPPPWRCCARAAAPSSIPRWSHCACATMARCSTASIGSTPGTTSSTAAPRWTGRFPKQR
ncbi:hypothetical protein [Nocardia asteroides]